MSDVIEIPIKILPHYEGLALPAYASAGAAGLDLRAAISAPVVLNPGERRLVPAGICISLPLGFEAQVGPRSGLAIKHGIGLLNSPGTIDSDYRGEIQVILVNFGSEPFTIVRGDQIAQMVIAQHVKADFKVQAELDVTLRNDGGFGHTGR